MCNYIGQLEMSQLTNQYLFIHLGIVMNWPDGLARHYHMVVLGREDYHVVVSSQTVWPVHNNTKVNE